MALAGSCAACGLPLSGRVAQVGDKLYHADCLTCSVCGNCLDGEGCMGPKGFLCKSCFADMQALLREVEECIARGDDEQANAIIDRLQASMGSGALESKEPTHSEEDHSEGAEKVGNPMDGPKSLLERTEGPSDDAATKDEGAANVGGLEEEPTAAPLASRSNAATTGDASRSRQRSPASCAKARSASPAPARDSALKAKPKAKAKARAASSRASGDGPEREKVLSDLAALDLNKDGKLQVKELAKVFKFLDAATWTDKAIDRLFQAMDADHNGVVDQNEFVNWIFNARGALHTKYNRTLELLPRWTELVEREAREAARALEEAMEREALREPHERRADAGSAILSSLTNKDNRDFAGYWYRGARKPTDLVRVYWTAAWYVLFLMYGFDEDDGFAGFKDAVRGVTLEEAAFPYLFRRILQLKIRLIEWHSMRKWTMNIVFDGTVYGWLRSLDHAELAEKLAAGGAEVRDLATLLALPFFGSKIGIPEKTRDVNYGTPERAEMGANGERCTKCLAEWLLAVVRPVVPEELMAEATRELRETAARDESSGKVADFPPGCWF